MDAAGLFFLELSDWMKSGHVGRDQEETVR